MYRLIRTLALFLSALFATGSLAQQVQTPKPTVVLAKPALWKVSDADTTIYLFGTVHALPSDVDWMTGPVATALTGATELVTELPETPDSEMQSAVASNAVLPAGQTLRALLTADERAKYEKAMAGEGLPVEAFDQFEPWFAALSLALTPVRASGYDPESGADVRIAARAKALGIPRTGLETAGYQLSLFSHLPVAVQKRYLAEVIDGIPTIPQEMADMIREWSAGHPDKVAELDNADEDDPQMIAVLLTNRNRIWADWVHKRMDKPGTVFMAVGAGHLAGKDSVLAMLAKSGLTVVRVQ